MADLEALLSEAKDAPPCGPNLERDLSFWELEQAALRKPEQEYGAGGERRVAKPAEEPKWPQVVELAHGLLGRSKDVRIAVYLTRGLTRTEGITGLSAGLRLVHGLLERYWDHLHPMLEADADSDPTERLNALAPLADSEALVKDVRDAHLVNSREHGLLEGREVEVALGRLPGARTAAGSVKSLEQVHAQIAAAFAKDRTVVSALQEAADYVLAIQSLVAERVGPERAIDLKPLSQCIGNLLEACDAALGTRGQTGAPEALSASHPAGAGDEAATELAAPGPLSAGVVRSREEALRILDLVCVYLERHEPTNPAPLFIRRAQRLMTKNFVEIVKDLIPDSLANLEKLAGLEKEKK